ncbi:MAG TPA: chemotaxis protein CheW [Stellaceae bacterium]|nr:chemotaxis protein CheW [Stellaceae bacterium]
MSDYAAIRVGSWDFAVPVMQVRDVLRRNQLTPVPLAPRAVAGLLNLRGRIVTAIDLRVRLRLPPQEARSDAAYVVIESGSEYYALIVDSVGDVLPIDERRLGAEPLALDPRWRAVASAVYTMDTGPIVLLDIERLLDLAPARRAAS